MLKITSTLFWFGIFIITVGILGGSFSFIQAVRLHVVGNNAVPFFISIVSEVWQGALLIGVAKILEKLSSKTN